MRNIPKMPSMRRNLAYSREVDNIRENNVLCWMSFAGAPADLWLSMQSANVRSAIKHPVNCSINSHGVFARSNEAWQSGNELEVIDA